MVIFIVRHGIATERSARLPDESRALTPKGIERMEGVARGLGRLGVRLDRIYHSPWTRASQTADLLAPLLDGDRVATEHLAGPPTRALLDTLEGEHVALVGHEPWMGELLALLACGDAGLGERFLFKKGGVAQLEGDPTPGGCELQALLPPKVLRRV